MRKKFEKIAAQPGQIHFANQAINGGALPAGGGLVPIPEARIIWAALALALSLALALFILWRERRRWCTLVDWKAKSYSNLSLSVAAALCAADPSIRRRGRRRYR